jgi:hypothetical protein
MMMNHSLCRFAVWVCLFGRQHQGMVKQTKLDEVEQAASWCMLAFQTVLLNLIHNILRTSAIQVMLIAGPYINLALQVAQG